MSVRRLIHLAAVGGVVVLVVATACSSEPERSVTNFCSQIESLRTLDDDLATGDPVRIQARADDLRLLAQVAPPEIEPSVLVLLGITDDFARTAGTATDRDEVADAVFRGRSSEVASIEAAGNEVSAYALENCGVDLGGAGSTSTSTSTPAETPTTPPPGATPTMPGGEPTTTTTSTPSLLVP